MATLAERFPAVSTLGATLVPAGLTVAVAESCTGGLLGSAITSVDGSSAYFRGGVIAYANDLKEEILGVDADLIAIYGAVSAQVVEAMAEGARRHCHADIGLAITGVAGPGGGTARKPVGLIYVGAARRGRDAVVRRLEGDSGRDANRERAVEVALDLALQLAK